MQELDKLLKEIDERQWHRITDTGNKPLGIIDVITVKNIIQKHINDGWVSVEERMPTKEECENNYFWIMLKYDTSPVIAKCSWIEAEDENGDDDSFSEFFIDQYPQMYTPSKNNVISWKIVYVPEPYKPERK